MLKHLIVVFVDGHTAGLEVLMRPLELGVTSAGIYMYCGMQDDVARLMKQGYGGLPEVERR